MKEENHSTARRWIVGITVLWPFAIGLILLNSLPNYPKSRHQWFMVVVFGPPAYLLLEAIGGWVFSEKHGYNISRKSFSVLRVVTALLITVAGLIVLVGMQWKLKN